MEKSGDRRFRRRHPSPECPADAPPPEEGYRRAIPAFQRNFFRPPLVASADASGNPVYNFAYVDMGLDFLHSIGLKPWIQLSFMPRVLALHPNKYLFNDNVSQPRSNQAWCNLIQVFFQHIRKRYGIEETRTWRYSLWNLPNTASFLYGFDNPEDFQTFYKASFDTIKNEDPAYFISMPPSYYKKYGEKGGCEKSIA